MAAGADSHGAAGADRLSWLRRGRPSLAALPLVAAAAAVALIVAFDLATPLPFNDEFIYQWTVRRLAEGHGLLLYPGQAPIALVQIAVGAVAYLIHPDPRMARLAAIPFIVATMVAVYRLSTRLGATRFFAAVAAAALPAMPVYAAASTGFMTEPFYLGLLAAVAVVCCRWLETGRGAVLVVALAATATLQRQHAAAIPPALTLALWVVSRRRTLVRAQVLTLAATWVVVIAALLVPGLLGLQTVQMRANLEAVTHPAAGAVAAAALYLPATAGLALLAFGAALLPGGQDGDRRWSQRPILPILAGCGVVIVAVTFILPGNYLTRAGLNPVTVAGAKPDLYPQVLPVIGVLALLTFALAAAQQRREWTRLANRPAAVFLFVLGALAMVPLLNGDVFDRYYLAVVLPWLPLAAVAARRARWPTLARAWAVAALLGGVCIYAAGEQDYQAWQGARQQAEGLATRSVAARDVFSGFETYGAEVVLPGFERTAVVPGFSGHHTTTAMAPAHPRAVLLITGPEDRRPGYGYSSLAPGRVVVVCLDPAGCR